MSLREYVDYKDSGVDWLGQIPTNWTVQPLRNVTDFTTGWTPPTGNADSYDGDFLWANISDLGPKHLSGTAKRLSAAAVAVSNIPLSPKGSLLFSFKLSVGSVSIVGADMYTNEAIATFHASEFLSVEYAYYALPICVVRNANENIYGAPMLNARLIRSARLAIPPMAQQQQITGYLDVHTAKIDTLIGKQERLIQTLAERRQAVVSHAVTKGLDPNVPMKDSGVEWLGQVPSRWTTGSLKRLIAKQQSGTSVNGVNTPADPNEIGVLKTSSVSTGVFDPDQNKAVVPEDWSRVTCPVTADTILVNRANSPERVGAAALVRKSIPNLYLSDKLWQITLAESDPTWLYWWFQTATYKDQVGALRVGTSSSMQNLSYEDFREIRVAFPEIGEQLIIAQYLDRETAQIDALSAKAREMIDVLKERRQALISAAVTGKIDVRGLWPDE